MKLLDEIYVLATQCEWSILTVDRIYRLLEENTYECESCGNRIEKKDGYCHLCEFCRKELS